mgnify:CR=1 FL=1
MTIILIIGKYNGHFLYLAYKELRINILIIRRKVIIKNIYLWKTSIYIYKNTTIIVRLSIITIIGRYFIANHFIGIWH